MNTPNPNPPAFPRPYSQDPTGEYKSHPQKGMSAVLFLAAHSLPLCESTDPQDIAVEALNIAEATMNEHIRRYGF